MITIHLSTDNSAFEGEGRGDEIARILRGAADRIEGNDSPEQFNLHDANGNTVGRVYDNDLITKDWQTS